ncbi:MAG TPA: bifunctional precorrin-2 dehydrogenase/sirohydrochlorin ferrochelatase [Acidimicrobiales bacterium]|nr:bifunctional precorrin-2 dehydrogenase/sirohydrochlorin ferrochelatase [Acidimicrobiales bacterium]
MPVDEPVYPVNLLLAGRPCLVVGGGRVALAKARGLLEAGAVVTVVAPDVLPELAALDVATEVRPYRSGEVAAYRFAVVATGDVAVDRQVYEDGEAAGVWVNSADDPRWCSAILPARVRQGRLVLTVSTGGHSPAVAAWVRRRLADAHGPEFDALIELVSEVRHEVQERGLGTERLDWQEALDSGILDMLRAGRLDEAKERLRACLSSSSD